MKTTELQKIAEVITQMFVDQDLEMREALEVALNVYGHVSQACDVSVHDAIGAVMTYYKTNADHRQ